MIYNVNIDTIDTSKSTADISLAKLFKDELFILHKELYRVNNTHGTVYECYNYIRGYTATFKTDVFVEKIEGILIIIKR